MNLKPDALKAFITSNEEALLGASPAAITSKYVGEHLPDYVREDLSSQNPDLALTQSPNSPRWPRPHRSRVTASGGWRPGTGPRLSAAMRTRCHGRTGIHHCGSCWPMVAMFAKRR